ncbi:MAG: histidine kinase [Betaproteobacteria bacterium]|nr:histidine kinase [Betaproteobacteria bacterium]
MTAMNESSSAGNPKKSATFFSLVQQGALLIALFCALVLVSMASVTGLTIRVQGNAHAINKAGTLRMQSYRLLANVSLTPGASDRLHNLADAFEADINSESLSSVLNREGLGSDLQRLQNDWQTVLRPGLLRHDNMPLVAEQVSTFVQHIDALVVSLEEKTEQHIQQTILLQKLFIVFSLLSVIAFVFYSRHRIVFPLRKLLGLASAIQHRNFKPRVFLRHHDELQLLAQTLNTAAHELEQSYQSLESRIAEKTTDLQQKNETLAFLYEALRALYHQGAYDNRSLHERFVAILDRVKILLPFSKLTLTLERRSPPPFPQMPASGSQRWELADAQTSYGWIEGRLLPDTPLIEEQRRLMLLLVDTFVVALVLEDQNHQREQWLLTEERTVIARELHDSMAQSLSYLKLRLATLQMQPTLSKEELHTALTEMRNEVNAAYRKLRELLTTFRLQLDQPGIDAALRKTVEEFSLRLGFPIDGDIQLLTMLPADKTIHLLHIAREAFYNIEKHSGATQASLKASHIGDEIVMDITDNGCGLPEDCEKRSHYGLAIMRDRAQSLGGVFRISNKPEGGVEVHVAFQQPQHTTLADE